MVLHFTDVEKSGLLHSTDVKKSGLRTDLNFLTFMITMNTRVLHLDLSTSGT